MTDQTKEAWTPGPWRTFNNGIIGVTGKLADVAHCSGFHSARTEEEEVATANLIAAAPDLYEALLHAQANMPHPDEMIDDALAKARGES